MASTENIIYVYSDIETDSFRGDQLLQIAAITQSNETFNTFIQPEGPLPLSITNFLGLYLYKGALYRDGLRLETKSPRAALTDFVKWIEQLQQPVMLIFHNGFNFDCNVLVKHLVDLKINIPPNLTKVGDTLPYFRAHLKAPLVADHKLSTLAKHFNISQDKAHDALADSITLKQICEKHVENKDSKIESIFQHSVRDVQNYIDRYLHNTPIPKLKKVKKPAE